MNKILNVMDNLDDFWDEEAQLLKTHIYIPIQSQSDILEKTGIVLAGLSMIKEKHHYANQWIKKIISGLKYNIIEDGFIPRTVAHQRHEPEERKSGLWEYATNKWARTDVSCSQMFYLCMGLYYTKEFDLLESILLRLSKNNWKILKLDGSDVPYGKFRPSYGNNGLRFIALLEMCHHLGVPMNTKWYDKLMLKINLCSMTEWGHSRTPSDLYNTSLIFMTLCKLDPSFRLYFKKWAETVSHYPAFDLMLGNKEYNDEYRNFLLDFPLDADESYFKIRDNENLYPGEGNILRADYILMDGLYKDLGNEYRRSK